MENQKVVNEIENSGKKTPKANKAQIIANYAPFVGFILIALFFMIVTGGEIFSTSNLQSLTNQVIVTALVSIGGVFNFGCGQLDMSLSGSLGLSAVLGAMVAIPTGNIWLAFIVCIGSALLLGLFKGVFSAYVQAPFFIITIVLGFVITAAILVMMGTETTLYLSNAVKTIPTLSFSQMTTVNVVSLVGFFVLCLILFNYTALGKKIKMLGGNIFAAKQTGIDVKKTKIISFLIAGLGVGIAAFIVLIRTRTVGYSTGGTLGLDVLVALVLGGMPIMGGPHSKISAGIMGAATITVLNSGLTMVGLSTEAIQITRGIIFIVLILVTSLGFRNKLLPR